MGMGAAQFDNQYIDELQHLKAHHSHQCWQDKWDNQVKPSNNKWFQQTNQVLEGAE